MVHWIQADVTDNFFLMNLEFKHYENANISTSCISIKLQFTPQLPNFLYISKKTRVTSTSTGHHHINASCSTLLFQKTRLRTREIYETDERTVQGVGETHTNFYRSKPSCGRVMF